MVAKVALSIELLLGENVKDSYQMSVTKDLKCKNLKLVMHQ
jgi:hypothetical protein